MSTPVTAEWRISFTKHTLLDDTQFTIAVTIAQGRPEAERIMTELKKKKYESIRLDLILTPTP